jgi:hypothetical protein
LPSPSIFRHTYAKEKTSLRHKCDSWRHSRKTTYAQ